MPAESTVATLALEVSSVLEPVFAHLEDVARTAAGTFPVRGRAWTEADLEPVQAQLVTLLGEDPLTAGMGFVAAPMEVDGSDRYMLWFQRRGDRTARLRLNFDPSSIDVYDYLQMEWFQQARGGRRRVAFGPYVDYSGSELYTVTATVPVLVEGRFVGVAGADLVVAELERRLIPVLRRAASELVLVSHERRVIAANTPRWVVGSRLPQMPAEGEGFAAVVELPVRTGWFLAEAVPAEE